MPGRQVISHEGVRSQRRECPALSSNGVHDCVSSDNPPKHGAHPGSCESRGLHWTAQAQTKPWHWKLSHFIIYSGASNTHLPILCLTAEYKSTSHTTQQRTWKILTPSQTCSQMNSEIQAQKPTHHYIILRHKIFPTFRPLQSVQVSQIAVSPTREI